MSTFITGDNGTLYQLGVTSGNALYITSVSSGGGSGNAQQTPAITGARIINRALRLLGVKQSGEAIDADIQTDALESLNDLLDAFNSEKLMVPSVSEQTYTLTSSDPSYTIGPGADFDTSRPVAITQGQAFIRTSNIDYELNVCSPEDWARIPDKKTSGRPTDIYYDANSETGTIHFYPVPNDAYTFVLWEANQLNTISNVSTEFYLPQGYARMLAYNLAVELFPEYPKVDSGMAVISDTARRTKAQVKRANYRPMTLQGDPALATVGIMDINSGGFIR